MNNAKKIPRSHKSNTLIHQTDIFSIYAIFYDYCCCQLLERFFLMSWQISFTNGLREEPWKTSCTL